MNLTATTTIDLPSTTDAEFIEYGSSRTFAVCVVDGERCHTHWDDGDERCCVCGTRYAEQFGSNQTHWPPWLTELTEPCIVCDGQGILNFGTLPLCPNCIKGRPAVQVWQDANTTFARGDGYGRQKLGRGTVEHILPVEIDLDIWDRSHVLMETDPNDGPPGLWMKDGDDDVEFISDLDISVTPGQYVVLVRIHE